MGLVFISLRFGSGAKILQKNRAMDRCPVWGCTYSHYSVISIAICLQLRKVLMFLCLDLRSTAMRSFQYYWEEREVRKRAFTVHSDEIKSNFTCLRRT